MRKTPFSVSILIVLLVSCVLRAEDKQRYELQTMKISAESIAAKVNGHTITSEDLFARLLRSDEGKTLDQMINELIIADEANAKGIAVTAREVQTAFDALKKDISSRNDFDQWLAAQGLTPEALKRHLRVNLMAEKLIKKSRKLSVTPEEVKKFFDLNKERLASPESIRCSFILVKSKEQAGEILFALRAGADFATMARAKSEDAATKENGGDTGFFSRGAAAKEFEDVAFSLKPGEIGEPLETPFGYFIIKTEEKKSGVPAKLDGTMRAKIKDMLMQDKVNAALPELIKELRTKYAIEKY